MEISRASPAILNSQHELTSNIDGWRLCANFQHFVWNSFGVEFEIVIFSVSNISFTRKTEREKKSFPQEGAKKPRKIKKIAKENEKFSYENSSTQCQRNEKFQTSKLYLKATIFLVEKFSGKFKYHFVGREREMRIQNSNLTTSWNFHPVPTYRLCRLHNNEQRASSHNSDRRETTVVAAILRKIHSTQWRKISIRGRIQPAQCRRIAV